MASKKELKTQNDSMPVMDFEFESGGMEGVDKESFAIPFLSILQTNSPQVEEGDPQYIEGAKAGMFYNSVTNECFDGKDEGVVFLPCAFQRRFLRWAPRKSGGGFKGEIMPEQAEAMIANEEVIRGEDGKLYFPLENGSVDAKKCDYLSDTRSHFGLLYHEDGRPPEQILFPLKSTQIKKSKQLMSRLRQARVKNAAGDLVMPPTWMNRVVLKTRLESNDDGSWYGLAFDFDGFIGDKAVYQLGLDFNKAIMEGEAKANYAAAKEESEGSDKF